MGDGCQVVGKGFQQDPDTVISYDDQQKINYFAWCNAKAQDVKAELTAKKKELKNMEDVGEELILYDESEGKLPFLQGEVFMYLSLSDTNRSLEREKRKVSDDIRELEEVADELKTKMSGLKTHLYGKFGNHINLEEED